MSSGEAAGVTRGGRSWQGHAFGLCVESAFPIPCVPLGCARESRHVELELANGREIDQAWQEPPDLTLIDARDDRRRQLSVAWRRGIGFRIWAPGYGKHLVKEDGRNVRSALPGVPAWRWQRLLFAQVLPLAAVLQGLEVFHASAVSLGGRAVAFVARSGTGKTSVAAHLVARGAELLTDDVLALEADGARVLAHPGAGMTSLAAHELERIPAGARRRFGKPIGRSDKVQLAVMPAEGPVPVGVVYFLRRMRDGELRIEDISADAQPLLASSYLRYLQTRQRLVGQLDVCARLAESASIFQVDVPASVPADGLAAALEAHGSERLDTSGRP